VAPFESDPFVARKHNVDKDLHKYTVHAKSVTAEKMHKNPVLQTDPNLVNRADRKPKLYHQHEMLANEQYKTLQER